MGTFTLQTKYKKEIIGYGTILKYKAYNLKSEK